jgi:pyrimidine-nucleoside phosphorylase/thymidine phosphorylase
MRGIVEIIAAKRDGGVLAEDEIRWLIAEFAAGRLPDYQMAAMAMAIYFRGLDDRETAVWTDAMLRSGRVLDLERLGPGRVDKHSTGGVGDKVSLPLAPAAAACGVIVPMVSGRGLGHTGGTMDKLEAIPGYRCDLGVEDFERVLREAGCAIIGQTADLAPADKRLYALRDVTATVESIPLISASIMSKKLAEGIEGLVLDVKVGRGAFMKTLEDARRLAGSMVGAGLAMGKRVIAFLTRMEEPLGRMVGHACEVEETLAVLRGGGPADIRELVLTQGAAMLEIAKGVSHAEGRDRIRRSLDDGTALARFERMVAAQGGELGALPRPRGETLVLAPRAGFVTGIDGRDVGLACAMLGAGRLRSTDRIDPVVGVRIEAPRGARVELGSPLCAVLHGQQGAPGEAAVDRLRRAFEVGDAAPPPAALVLERIG